MIILRPSLLCEPNIIKPLHWMNPRTIKGQKWWDRERRLAYAKNDYYCMACWVHKNKAKYHKWLEAHEVYSINFDECSYTLKEIVPLCYSCHNFIHLGRLQAIYNKWEITEKTYEDIFRHWAKILRAYKLDRVKAIVDLCWGEENIDKWCPEKIWTRNKRHLVIDWEKHYSQFANYQDWYKHYN